MDKKIYLFKIIQSNYCKIAFLSSFLISYFLIPDKIFIGWFTVIAILFMLAFSLTITCLVRNIKEKIILAKAKKSSLLSIIAIIIGLSALQVCGVGAPICGATIGLGVLSLFLPSVALNFLTDYSIYIILTMLAIQIISLYQMNCFQQVPCNPET